MRAVRNTTLQELKEDEGHKLTATLHTNLTVEATQIGVDRGRSQVQTTSDLGLGKGVEDEPDDLGLAAREPEALDEDVPFLVSEQP